MHAQSLVSQYLLAHCLQHISLHSSKRFRTVEQLWRLYYSTVRKTLTSGRCGEESSPRGLTVTIGQLRPVLQGENAGGNWAALRLVGGGGHRGVN